MTSKSQSVRAGAADPSEPTPPRVSVVIPTYNRAERCARLLRTLADQTIGPDAFEVIAVDDCSEDDTTAVLDSLVSEVPYRLRPMRTAANGGAGPARNLGWRAADAPVVAFTDDDCVPEPQWLAEGIKPFATNPKLGLVQGRTKANSLDDPNVKRACVVVVDGPNPYFESCNIFYRRKALVDAGGFGEEYNWWSSPAWCEDTLVGWAALEAGWESDFSAGALVTHDVESRSLRWWIKTSLSQYREVAIAQRYPEYRERTFWRPWAPRRHDAAFVLAVLAAAGATRWRPAALAAAPYLWWRRPSIRRCDFVRGCAETVAIDCARTVGNLYGAMRSRTFVI